MSAQPLNRIAFGHWRDGGHAEDVVVCCTGVEQVEVHCHGGAAPAERILGALAAAGCRISPWQDWPPTAGGLAIDAAAALAYAPTRRTAAILLDQSAGAFDREVAAIRRLLANRQMELARRGLNKLLHLVPLGSRLTQPWHVALAGPPNVGKSSLLNAILGYQRAIVFDQPGTTRDVLDAVTAIDGWPVRLTDGAGIREAADTLEAAGIAQARQQLKQADLVVWVLDATKLSAGGFAEADALACRACAGELGDDARSIPLLAVVNKIDLVDPPGERANNDAASTLLVSAFTGAGLEGLLAAIARRLVPAPPAPGDGVPFTAQQAELIDAASNRLNSGDLAGAIATLKRLARQHD